MDKECWLSPLLLVLQGVEKVLWSSGLAAALFGIFLLKKKKKPKYYGSVWEKTKLASLKIVGLSPHSYWSQLHLVLSLAKGFIYHHSTEKFQFQFLRGSAKLPQIPMNLYFLRLWCHAQTLNSPTSILYRSLHFHSCFCMARLYQLHPVKICLGIGGV